MIAPVVRRALAPVPTIPAIVATSDGLVFSVWTVVFAASVHFCVFAAVRSAARGLIRRTTASELDVVSTAIICTFAVPSVS